MLVHLLMHWDIWGHLNKAELLQLKLTPIICLMNFVNKKVGNLKN
jgi:hypothetical protein